MSNENHEEMEEKKCCCGHHHDSDSCCGNHKNEEHRCGCGCEDHENEEHQCGCGCGHHDAEKQIPDIDDIPDVPFPQPTLQSFSESIGTQALVSLGLIPNPMTGKPVVRLNQAKHLIDSIQLLFEKTEGNRTAEETQFMEGILHELHMIYISVQQKKS
ncbi:MAG: DUF1844 domain-containing protein [Planctomycetia bacterium]|nr:DUF1844 domain-containing protein [Planctomycetia bacterium]